MKEKDNLALVLKPSSALEQAEPAAKRILSAMVADTLALASGDRRDKPHRLTITLVEDEPLLLEIYVELIRERISTADTVTFTNPLVALQELWRADPDLLITGAKMPGLSGEDLVRRLIARGVSYPILVLTMWYPAQQWVYDYASRGFNVRFHLKPFGSDAFESLRISIERALKIQDRAATLTEAVGEARRTRPLRIVILDDEVGYHFFMLKWHYYREEILRFGNARDARRELSHADADLFIMSFRHPLITCREMLTWLAERNVNYPILVADSPGEGRASGWGPNLNVSFLGKDGSLGGFLTAVEAALQMPAQRPL